MMEPQNRNLPALPASSHGITHYAPIPAPAAQEAESEEQAVPFSH